MQSRNSGLDVIRTLPRAATQRMGVKVKNKFLMALSIASVVAFGTGVGFAAASTYSVDAIAVDDVRGLAGDAAGYGVGQGDNADAANAGAMEACAKAGNSTCKLMLTYEACGAYASNKTVYGTGQGDSKEAAAQAAIQACGHDGCQLVVADCVS
jgi:hypothetical protein